MRSPEEPKIVLNMVHFDHSLKQWRRKESQRKDENQWESGFVSMFMKLFWEAEKIPSPDGDLLCIWVKYWRMCFIQQGLHFRCPSSQEAAPCHQAVETCWVCGWCSFGSEGWGCWRYLCKKLWKKLLWLQFSCTLAKAEPISASAHKRV